MKLYLIEDINNQYILLRKVIVLPVFGAGLPVAVLPRWRQKITNTSVNENGFTLQGF
jgi:hypothetical protein